MKRICIVLISVVIFTNTVFAQQNLNDKYSVQLPDVWKGKSGFLYKLAKVIDAHIPALNNKKVCFDCKANYKVTFHVSPPDVEYVFYLPGSDYSFTTFYNFYSYMDVTDSAGKILHRLVLNDSTIVHSVPFKLNSRGRGVQPVQNTIQQIKDNAMPQLQEGQRDMRISTRERIDNMTNLSNQFDDVSFIKNNKAALTPTENQLWNKVREIIIDFNLEEYKAEKNKQGK